MVEDEDAFNCLIGGLKANNAFLLQVNLDTKQLSYLVIYSFGKSNVWIKQTPQEAAFRENGFDGNSHGRWKHEMDVCMTQAWGRKG